MNRSYDIPQGTTFGQWAVLWPTIRTSRRQKRYVCQCACGRVKVVAADSLTAGKTSGCVTCGNTTHGLYGTPEYKAYFQAKDRCTNSRCSSWSDYGGRGIRFRFKSLRQWLGVLGPRPTDGHSVDRMNNDGDYAPENVRWATQSEQNYNRRSRAA